ncbi:hypothetical protein MMC24_004494 [Lignoscripta atroalba]|nr:hypothetical protein [Lignoscripta atroalba]
MVFLAKDLTNEDLVAIKCLTKPSTTACPATEVSRDDHLVELACHDRLGYHPNIVNLIHAFETDSHMYLVLEFCSMGDLYEAIRLGRGPLETEHVRSFMLQLVSAVDFMHSKGLYHRDIKPENIFLTQDGSLKLGDFGLATTETWSHESSVGSDRYMAPEQYEPADSGYSPGQADIWAIGICLLNVLFSRNPFVTPTESDVLFADFVRDKQSLFDVFPNMSQDTFEVLVHAMTIDPKKRSLSSLRDALERVISFTTDDDVLDEFCTEDREVIAASANRQPLRTPSIQSSPVDQGGAFPWARALHMSPPQTARQLSVIPDTESYSEDLFPASEKEPGSWYSVAAQTPSLASVLDSALGDSVKSMILRQPQSRNPARASQTPLSGSLPITASKPMPAMSMVFGKKDDVVSKSWSDLWDEDEEDMESPDARREYNSRSWSQESKDDPTIRRSGLAEAKSSSFVNTRTRSPDHGYVGVQADGVNENDGFFFEDIPTPRRSPAYSPPSKRSIMDKWAALGNRRRAFHQDSIDYADAGRKRSNTGTWRRGFGLKASAGNVGAGVGMGIGVGTEAGVWDRKGNTPSVGGKVLDWRRDHHYHYHSDKFHEKEKEDDQGDLEWVGGWHDLHL